MQKQNCVYLLPKLCSLSSAKKWGLRHSGKELGGLLSSESQETLSLANSAPLSTCCETEGSWGWGHRWTSPPTTSLLWADAGGPPRPTWLTVKPWILSPTRYCSARSQALVLPHLQAPRWALLHLRKGVRWSAGRLANIIQQHNKNTAMWQRILKKIKTCIF